jgi:hypothetical protein
MERGTATAVAGTVASVRAAVPPGLDRPVNRARPLTGARLGRGGWPGGVAGPGRRA